MERIKMPTRKMIVGLLLSFGLAQGLFAEEDANQTEVKKEKSFRVVPLVSANPTSGTGVGAISSYIYKLDPNSSPSQWMVAGQYTNTDSWNTFTRNIAYLQEDRLLSMTGLSYAHNKSQFSTSDTAMNFDVGYDSYADAGKGVRFDVDVTFVGQKLLYQIEKNYWLGGHAFYISQQFSNPNKAGKDFIESSGIENSSRGAVGLDASYDTRSKKERFYARDAEWFSLSATSFPSALGAEETYCSLLADLRLYRPGFNEEDVWANQFYGKYTSENAPDGGLAALGSRNVLRGFPLGKYKARYLTAFQSEYRYQFVDTNYRAVVFAGIANLSGGSSGTESGSREENNGYYYSGGVGVRYAIQKRSGVDLRVDIVITNDNEQSIYVGLNQAF